MILFLLAISSLFQQHLTDAAILSTEQIKIPGYPAAYNASLIPYQDGYLLSFRYVSRFPKHLQNQRTDASFIGLAKLTKKLKVVEKSAQILPIQSHSSTFSLTAEDGRLFSLGHRTLLFFNDLSPSQKEGFAMYFAEVVEEAGAFKLKEPAKPLYYPLAIRIEKNWSPFAVGDQLYLIYADKPRILLQVDLNTGLCSPISSPSAQEHWEFGPIRGGTPALSLDNSYLTFFHSPFPAKTPKGKIYFMGAYLFDPEPPFAIRAITPGPLGALTDYTKDNHLQVAFPCGLVILEKKILVSWGKGDRQIQITTFDKQKLLNSMKNL